MTKREQERAKKREIAALKKHRPKVSTADPRPLSPTEQLQARAVAEDDFREFANSTQWSTDDIAARAGLGLPRHDSTGGATSLGSCRVPAYSPDLYAIMVGISITNPADRELVLRRIHETVEMKLTQQRERIYADSLVIREAAARTISQLAGELREAKAHEADRLIRALAPGIAGVMGASERI